MYVFFWGFMWWTMWHRTPRRNCQPGSWAWRLRVVLHQLTSIKWNSRSGIRIYDVFPDVTCSPLGVLPENGWHSLLPRTWTHWTLSAGQDPCTTDFVWYSKDKSKVRVLNSESHVSPKGLVRVVVILPIMNPANEHDPSFGMRWCWL